MFESTSFFAKHFRNLHKEISDKFNISNQIYEQLADSHKQVKNFAECDFDMIRIRPEQFSQGLFGSYISKKQVHSKF